ncbi:MAG: GNAT family N-acetyltransferase [Pontibacterium sp.]
MPPVNNLSEARVVQVKADQLPQLNRFYRRNGHKGKACPEDYAFWLEQKDTIVAAVRFSAYEQGLLMRGLWVHKALRGRGLGQQLLSGCQTFWKQQPCYCFPYAHLQGFYERSGFTQAGNQTPQSLKNQLRRYQQRGQDLILMEYQPP